MVRSSDRQSLLQAVLDHPFDDVFRLILADWLEENGHLERAELVRLQIELARTPRSDRAEQLR